MTTLPWHQRRRQPQQQQHHHQRPRIRSHHHLLRGMAKPVRFSWFCVGLLKTMMTTMMVAMAPLRGAGAGVQAAAQDTLAFSMDVTAGQVIPAPDTFTQGYGVARFVFRNATSLNIANPMDRLEFTVFIDNVDQLSLLGGDNSGGGAQICCGAPGSTGPIVAVLSPPVDNGGNTDQQINFRGALQDTDLVNTTTSCGATVSALADALVLGTAAYVNIASAEHPSGELRAQDNVALLDTFVLPVSGDQVVPLVASNVTGSAALVLSDTNVDAFVVLSNLDQVGLLGGTNGVGATMNCGVRGTNGPAVAVLAEAVDGGISSTILSFSRTLGVSSIMNISCGETIDELALAMERGRLYVQIVSTEHPDGEVRGQIPPTLETVHIHLSGDAEVPPLTTEVDGDIYFYASLDRVEMDYEIMLQNPNVVYLLAGDPGGANIHCGPIGEVGPVVVVLATADEADPSLTFIRTGNITDADIIDATCGSTLADLFTSLQQGDAYVNVASAVNPNGEVRGQIDESMLVPTAAPIFASTTKPTFSGGAVIPSTTIKPTLAGGTTIPPVAPTDNRSGAGGGSAAPTVSPIAGGSSNSCSKSLLHIPTVIVAWLASVVAASYIML